MTPYSDHEDDSVLDPEFCWYCSTECKTYEEQTRGVCNTCFEIYNEAKDD
jgi:hypothetical protein